MVEVMAQSKDQEVETDLQLSYITSKNNSLIEQISSQLTAMDSISILVDEKRAILRHNQSLAAARRDGNGIQFSRDGEL